MTAKKVAPRTKAVNKKSTAAVKKAPSRKVVKKAPATSRVTSPANVSNRVVDEIPKTRRGAAKSTRYRDTLSAIRRDVGKGKPVIVAEFNSPSGAAQVRRQLLKGNLLCDGKVNDWEFTARRISDGDGSILYAELNT